MEMIITCNDGRNRLCNGAKNKVVPGCQCKTSSLLFPYWLGLLIDLWAEVQSLSSNYYDMMHKGRSRQLNMCVVPYIARQDWIQVLAKESSHSRSPEQEREMIRGARMPENSFGSLTHSHHTPLATHLYSFLLVYLLDHINDALVHFFLWLLAFIFFACLSRCLQPCGNNPGEA